MKYYSNRFSNTLNKEGKTMGNRDIQRKYSLRKFKGVGLASAVIGLFFANGAVEAAVTSNGTNEPTIVSDTSKVESAKATTFTDDTNEKLSSLYTFYPGFKLCC